MKNILKLYNGNLITAITTIYNDYPWEISQFEEGSKKIP